MKIRLLLLITLLISVSINAQVLITSVNQSTNELLIKSDLELLHEEYDLSRWEYTNQIRIDQDARTPHSHPVLTMSTQQEYLDSRIKLLSSYLHEQFHWHVIENGKASKQAFRTRIKNEFPSVKVGFPYGSRDEGSTLSHIVICYLEYIALSELIGPNQAQENLSTNNYYTWVYQTILDPRNRETLDRLLTEFGLEFRGVSHQGAN